MLRLIKPTVAKVSKDVAELKSMYDAGQPNPNCGVRFAPIEYFRTPQTIDKGISKSGIAMFPGTLTPEQFEKEAANVAQYQQRLLAKYADWKK